MKSVLSLAAVLTIVVAISVPLRASEYRILLPVTADSSAVPGGFGSRWSGELWAHNSGENHVVLTTSWALCVIVCPPGEFILAPGQTRHIAAAPHGMIHVRTHPYGTEAKVAFNARIFDESRLTGDRGTEIPLIPERDFASSLDLLNISITPDFRITLRIFESTGARVTEALVSAYDMTGIQLVEKRVMLSPLHPVESAFGVGYYQATLTDLMSGLPEGGAIRLRVAAATPAQRLWAFVSVTHNETQRVTLVTPQGFR